MVSDSMDLSAPCTRKTAVIFMWMDAGGPVAEREKTFTDVGSSEELMNATAWAVEQGVITGTGDGTTFSPDAACTRGQTATFLYRASQT